MVEIIPAILPSSFSDIESQVSLVLGTSKIVQLDLVDGVFVKNRTWPYNNKDQDKFDAILKEEMGLPFWEKINYEIDAMVTEPNKKFKELLALAPSRIVFHFESLKVDEWKSFFESLDSYYKENIEIGMAINTTTNPDLLEPIIKELKFIQCMGIENVGFQKQLFDERAIDQIKKVRSIFPEMQISVDGGINLENARNLADAGANRLVIGSALFGSIDIRGTLEEFNRVCKIN